MKRTVASAGIVLCILVLGLGLSTSHSQASSQQQTDSAIKATISSNYTFAQNIIFAGEFISTSPIRKTTLLFAEKGDTRIYTTDLTPDGRHLRFKTEYNHDLRSYPLRAFAVIEYWWYVEDEDGHQLETEKNEFIYADNRYPWKSASGEHVIVYWDSEDLALGHTAVRIAEDGLERISPLLPNTNFGIAHIYIYPTSEALRAALRLGNREWVGGHADPEWGVILTSANGATASIDLQQIIPHEIAHFALYRSTGGENHQAPAWLHEGIAVRNETRPDPAFAVALEKAVANQSLIPMASLCTVFPEEENSALQAYAQSASLVRYLQNQYGNNLLKSLIAAYGDGADCSGGVERVLDKTLSELEAEWQADLMGKTVESTSNPTITNMKDLTLWIGLLLGGTLIMGSFYFLRPGKTDDTSNEQAPQTP